MSALSFLLALLRAIPTLKEWFDELVSLYVKSQIQSMREENKNAIRDAIEKQDQRPIEKAIGNPTPGNPSNLPGTERRHSLPNVK